MRAAGVILARSQDAQWLYLLLRVYRYWDFPKGLIEPGESDADAARRELHEETGIASTQLDCPWGDLHFDTEPYRNGKIARYFLARTSESAVRLMPNSALGRAEHHEYRWMSYEAAQAVLVPRLQHVLSAAHAQVIALPAR